MASHVAFLSNLHLVNSTFNTLLTGVYFTRKYELVIKKNQPDINDRCNYPPGTRTCNCTENVVQ